MTPEQKVLRDVWLSECWRPVREWHQTKDEKADADERNDLLGRAVESTAETVEEGAA